MSDGDGEAPEELTLFEAVIGLVATLVVVALAIAFVSFAGAFVDDANERMTSTNINVDHDGASDYVESVNGDRGFLIGQSVTVAFRHNSAGEVDYVVLLRNGEQSDIEPVGTGETSVTLAVGDVREKRHEVLIVSGGRTDRRAGGDAHVGGTVLERLRLTEVEKNGK